MSDDLMVYETKEELVAEIERLRAGVIYLRGALTSNEWIRDVARGIVDELDNVLDPSRVTDDDEQFCSRCFVGMESANHHECDDVRIKAFAARCASVPPEQPSAGCLLDREAVSKAVASHGITSGRAYTRHEVMQQISETTDAVMALAVPVPTREQLGIFLHSFDGFAIEAGESWGQCNPERRGAFLYQADALLDLMQGGDHG